MSKLLALFWFVLSLVGCVGGNHTVLVRIDQNGTDLLHSQVRQTVLLTEFHCIASATGVCHYTLFDHACPAKGSCHLQPYRSLDVRAGQTLYDNSVTPDAIACVSAEPDKPTENCPARVVRT
jgi:hypothetical protein